MRGEQQFYDLKKEQEQRIRSAVASPNCRIILTKEESEQYEAEQWEKEAAKARQRELEEEKAKDESTEEKKKQATADLVLEDAKQEPNQREAAEEALVTQDAAQQEASQESQAM